MESNLLRTAPTSDSGNGGGPNDSWDREWTMMVEEKRGPVREGSLLIKLDLGVGTSSEQNPVVKEGKPVFTHSQLMELNQQALIFKYIAAGVSVPLHLVLPIWKSVASSFGPANGGIYNQYPSFVGLSPQGFAYGNIMDPEPGRCRRTDGKKWRCSKDAVHTQKYCERHMYRGRQRSKKHVEVSETAYPSDTTPPINNNTENANTNLSISVPASLQIRSPHSNTKSISNNTATISSNINNASNDNVGNHQNLTTTLTTTVTTTGNKYSTRDGNENNDNSPANNYKSANRNRDNWNINSVVTVASPVLGFLPKSVLQCVTIAGRGGLIKIYTDPEPRRCRRTDGKRWRCNNDVVPDQKYCERHMYRGMKRRRHTTGASTVASSLTTTSITRKAADDHLNMKTNFSISIPEDSQVMINEGKSTTSECSSNTISNTSITNENSNASSHTSGRSP